MIHIGEDALIEYEEFDREAERCGARDEAGRMAFGGSREVIAAMLGPVLGDEWIDATLEALHRDRDPRWVGRRNELTISRGSGEMYHVTASANRSSIQEHGLDWRRMGALPGIAGSREPELDAIFLCETLEDTEFYTDMGRSPSDIWAANVDGLWIENGISGWVIVAIAIPPERVRLIERDVEGNRW